MTIEKLKEAEQLNECLETLKGLKEVFKTAFNISVNQVGTVGLTDEVLSEFKQMNIEYHDKWIKNIEEQFEEL